MIFSYLFDLFFLIVSVQKPLFKLCKTNFDMEKIKKEEKYYQDLPKMYNFASDKEKEIMLNRNFKRINDEVDAMISELLGITPQTP